MNDRRSKAPRDRKKKGEEDLHLASLREHGRVVESTDPDVDLPPGVTHVLVPGGPDEEPTLVERRKSFL